MNKMSAAARRFYENATLIAAQRLLFKSLDEMGIPLKKLADVAQTSSGGTPSRNVSEYFGGDIPWIKSGDLTDGLILEVEEHITQPGLENSSAQIFPAGTIVIALYGATVGKTGILTFTAASNQAVCAIIPKDDRIKNEFLYWFLRHKRQDFLDASFGGAQPNISQKLLRETMIPIPSLELQKLLCRFFEIVERRQKGDRSFDLPELSPPLSEQRRIVAKIEQLAAKIEEARSLRQHTAERADAIVQSKSKYFFDISGKHANLVFLENISTRITKGESPEWQGFTYQETGPIFIRSENVLWGKLDLSKRICIPLEFHKKLNRSQLYAGDVLINLVGASIGRCCIVPDDIGDANVNQAVAVISPDPERVESAYLMHFLISSPTQKIIHGGKVETARPNISLTDLRNLILPVPSLDDQRRIVAYLDGLQAQVDRLKALQAQTAAELEALLPSILDQAFKGEL